MRSTLAVRASSFAIALALVVLGCARRPSPPPLPPDVDGTPQGSRLLPFADSHSDTVDRAGGDLDDWYRIEVGGAGKVRLTLAAPPQGALPNLTLALTDASGVARVEPTRSGGRARVEVARDVEPGTYLVWVGTEPAASASGIVPYELEAGFSAKPVPKPVVRKPRPRPPPEPSPPPPPPPPRIETLVTSLVEVERPRDDGQFATIAGGERMGLRPGLTGRLVDEGRTLGTFEIVEVYSGGSRIKIHGRLSGPVSGRTAAQVDVPTGP